MALSDDLRKRVVEAVVLGGASRNAAARRFGVSIASAVRWVTRYKTTGQISPSPSGGDRRSGRIEAQRDYLLGLIGRTPDITLLEIQERLMQNCGERFSVSVLWRFFDRHGVTFKKRMARPVRKRLCRDWLLIQSASTYPASEALSPGQDGDTRVPVPGECPELCAGPGFHQVLTKRSPNMMANWVFASAHSRGGIFHC